eukprot:1790906-Pyramimonas_sp.AAC.1
MTAEAPSREPKTDNARINGVAILCSFRTPPLQSRANSADSNGNSLSGAPIFKTHGGSMMGGPRGPHDGSRWSRNGPR